MHFDQKYQKENQQPEKPTLAAPEKLTAPVVSEHDKGGIWFSVHTPKKDTGFGSLGNPCLQISITNGEQATRLTLYGDQIELLQKALTTAVEEIQRDQIRIDVYRSLLADWQDAIKDYDDKKQEWVDTQFMAPSNWMEFKAADNADDDDEEEEDDDDDAI
jgi:hypothetical protein